MPYPPLELGVEDYVEKSDPQLFMVKIERVLERMPPGACRSGRSRESTSLGFEQLAT
jgi:hypothetical protein